MKLTTTALGVVLAIASVPAAAQLTRSQESDSRNKPAETQQAKPGDVKPARAEGTAEVSEKTETGTTLTGNKKTTKTKKVEGADGSKTETKTTTEVKK